MAKCELKEDNSGRRETSLREREGEKNDYNVQKSLIPPT